MAAYAAWLPGAGEELFAFPAGLALASLVLGLAFGVAVLVPTALLLLGGEYAIALVARGEPLDERAPLVAAAFVAAAELSYWALELRGATVDEPGILARRALRTAVFSGAAAAVAVFMLGVTTIALGGSSGWEVLGVAALVAAFAIVVALARRVPD